MSDSSSSQKGVQVFLSYGRRDASNFVERLAKDLSDAGHRVWRDISDLEVPRSWDTQLSRAIDNSDVMVAVLTPHAVRTAKEESVCLDELAVARFHNPPTPIIPVMLITCEPPFVIYRLQWIDFQGTDADSTRYHAALDQLLKAIDKAAHGAAPSHRNVQFEPLDFDLYLSVKTRSFVGREWLSAEVFQQLSRPEPKTIILVGEAGWGKTAFAGHLFATNPDGRLVAAHFCRADRVDTIDPRRFVQSITAMTALRIPDYADRLSALLSTNPQFGDETEMFERLFAQPLAKMDATAFGPVSRYLLIDGLDEAFAATGSSGLARLLARAAVFLPNWLRLLVTSRDAFGIVDSFPSAVVIKLDRYDPRNQSDISHLIASHIKLAGLGAGRDNVDSALLGSTMLVQAIGSKADGNALVASQLSAAVSISGLNAAVVAGLPRDLSALYQALMERRIDPHGAGWVVVREILELILATDAALPISLAAAVRGDQTEYATRGAVNSISDLLNNQSDTVQVFHQTFREFLNLKTTPFFVNSALGARKLADFAISKRQPAAPTSAIAQFCRQQLIFWILRSENIQAYCDDLVSIYGHAVDDRRFNTAVGAQYTSHEDHDIIRAYATAGLSENLLSVARIVLKKATEAMDASGALKWLNSSRPEPDEELKIPMMQAVFKSVSLTGFALEWLRLILQSEPRSAQDIHDILNDNARLPYVFGWFDVIGAGVLGISRAFEDYGTVIYRDWHELAEKAKHGSEELARLA